MTLSGGRAIDKHQTAKRKVVAMHQQDLFAATITTQNTHSFIDSLTTVRLVTELLRDYPDLDRGQQQFFLDLILNSTDRLIHLIHRTA